MFSSHCDPARKRLQAQRGDVDGTSEFRVSRVEHLKATVAKEPVDHIGAHAAAHVIARLPHPDLAARGTGVQGGAVHGSQHTRTPQSGQSRADNQDFHVIACH